MASTDTAAPSRNLLLSALPESELNALRPHLERVELETRQLVFDCNVPISHVYFVESGVVSVVGVMSNGTAVEVATVGREGFVGLPVFLGTDRTPARAFCQVPGSALRLPAGPFKQLAANGALHRGLLRYMQALFVLLAQSAACNRVHSIGERCARWLLLTHDRVDDDTFPLTQEFLAQMLGVRRASVTDAASELQAENLISYHRGEITIRDRQGLEGYSCECYGIIKAEFERMMHGRDVPSPIAGLKASRGGKSLVRPPDQHE